MKLKVSDVLGDDYDLARSIRHASNIKIYTPTQIVLAARTRYVGRVMRALRTRPDPRAPVLLFTSTYFTETPAELKRQLLAYFKTLRTTDIAVGILEARYFRQPILGFCTAAGHQVAYDAASGNAQKLRYLIDVSDDSVDAWHARSGLCPGNLSRNLLCVCPEHSRQVCAACNARWDFAALSDQEVIHHVTADYRYCASCNARGWLCDKKPPRLTAHTVRLWRATAREFVAAL